jgi:hypothetical protein
VRRYLQRSYQPTFVALWQWFSAGSSLPQAPLSAPCRLGTPNCKLQVKTRSGACTHASPRALQHRTLPPSQGGLWGCHVFSGSGSSLPDRRAPTPPRVPWLQTPPPYKGGLRCTMCPKALDPASLQRRAPEHRVSYSFGSYLHIGRAPLPSPHAMRFHVDRGPQT